MKFRILFSSMALLLIPFSMNAATLSPAVLDLQASRGETISSMFTVINTSAAEQKYYLDIIGFVPRDESGTPQFLEKGKGSELIKWIHFPAEQISVPARSKIEVPFQVIVPADIASGNKEAAITVSSAPSDIVATNGAIIEAKTALLVFLTIKGETIRQVALLDFVDGSVVPIRSEIAGTFSYRIQNQGTVYAIPNGTIQLKDMFGRVFSRVDTNATKGRVLPGSTRKFEVNIGDSKKNFLEQVKNQMQSFTIGPITSELSIEFGEGFKPIHTQTTFWYIPYQLIVTILLALLIVFFLYRSLSKTFSKKH